VKEENMKCKWFTILLILAMLSLIFGTGINLAQADSVQIDEYWYSSPGPYIGEDGYFNVQNNSLENIFCIVIAGDQFDYPGFHPHITTPPARSYEWISASVTRAEWEAGFDFQQGAYSVTYYDSESGITWTPPVTSSINWDEYFEGESRALIYWTGADYEWEQGEQGYAYFGALEPGGSYDGFLFVASGPASPFLAFGSDGTVLLDSGETTLVPIPGAIWLLGSGIFGIVGIRRKFKK
jgi:hypothetical protein